MNRLAGRSDVIAVALVVVLCSIAAWPLAFGLPQTADGAFHLYRAFGLNRALEAGIIYPRVVPDFFFGYGYPLFDYYPPLSSYFVVLWQRLGLDFADAVRLSYAATFPLAGLATYILARALAGATPSRAPWAGAVAAVAYVFGPYFLITVYIRGALAEALAFALLPAAFWAMRRLALGRRLDSASGSRAAIIGTALLVAAFILTHAPLAAATLPLLAVYGTALAWRSPRRARDVAMVVLAIVLGLGLSAFFWLPAVVERGWVVADNLTRGWYDFHNHFLTWAGLVQPSPLYPGAFHPIPPQLGLVQVFCGVVGLVAMAFLPRRREMVGFAAVGLLGVYLSIDGSAWVWERVPLLAGMSFPWRLLIWSGLALALLAATPLLVLPQRAMVMATPLLLVLPIAATMAALRVDYFPPRSEAVGLEEYWRFEFQTMFIGTTSANEYLPRHLPESAWSAPRVPDSAYRAAAAPSSAEPSARLMPARLLNYSPQEVRLLTDGAAAQPLRLHAVYFPGWQATLDGAPLPIAPTTSLALVTAIAPPGRHELALYLGPTDAQWLGILASALSLLGLLAALAPVAIRRWRRTALGIAVLVVLAVALVPSSASGGRGQVSGLAEPVVFGNEVALLGHRLDDASPSQKDDGAIRLGLVWQALALPSANHVLRFTLRAADGAAVAAWQRHPHYGYSPMLRWQAGEIVYDEQVLSLPATVADGRYRLEVAFGPFPETAALGDVAIAAARSRPTTEPPPQFQRPLSASFGDRIELLGYDTDTAIRCRPGDEVPLTLYWQLAGGRLADRSYTVFVHLVDEAGRGAGQGDAEPQDGLRPTILWQQDEVVADTHLAAVDMTATPGRYYVDIGVYFRPTMERLPLLQSGRSVGDRLRLPDVAVEVVAR